uniref:Uncharacterized protein n=1 Tax=Gopherus agassizii TaxID=38772 RepID=A0A452HYN2_9SAUR
MEAYHKPDQQALQALKDAANRLRISSIRATTAAGSGTSLLPSSVLPLSQPAGHLASERKRARFCPLVYLHRPLESLDLSSVRSH